MYGQVRRKDRETTKEQALEILKNADYGVLATVDSENKPCTVALNYELAGENILYFHCGLQGEKLDNIRHNANVSFFVIGKAEVVADQFTMAYSSVVVHGTARIVEDQNEKKSALKLLTDKYANGIPQASIDAHVEKGLKTVNMIRLDIENLTGKARLSRKRS